MLVTLAEFTEELAQHVAHKRGWPLELATRWVESHLAEARQEYRDRGAPLGDTDEGFIAWLMPRYRPPAA